MAAQPAPRRHETEAKLSLEKLKAACRWAQWMERVLLFLILLASAGIAGSAMALAKGTATSSPFWFVLASGIHLSLSFLAACAYRRYLEHKHHEKLAEWHAEEYRKN